MFLPLFLMSGFIPILSPLLRKHPKKTQKAGSGSPCLCSGNNCLTLSRDNTLLFDIAVIGNQSYSKDKLTARRAERYEQKHPAKSRPWRYFFPRSMPCTRLGRHHRLRPLIAILAVARRAFQDKALRASIRQEWPMGKRGEQGPVHPAFLYGCYLRHIMIKLHKGSPALAPLASRASPIRRDRGSWDSFLHPRLQMQT